MFLKKLIKIVSAIVIILAGTVAMFAVGPTAKAEQNDYSKMVSCSNGYSDYGVANGYVYDIKELSYYYTDYSTHNGKMLTEE